MTTRKILLVSVFLLLISPLCGVHLSATPPSLMDRFISYQENPQQKLYVQTDKDFYSAGEKIWFAAFLVEAVEHQPTYYDQFIYVDLFAPDGSVAANQIIRRDSTGFNGMIALPATLQEGEYVLRGYSKRMIETSPDFLFHKPIHIGNKILTDISTKTSFSEQPGKNRRAEIQFIRNNKEPMSGKHVWCVLEIDGVPQKGFRLKSDKQGTIAFDLTTEAKKGERMVLICTIEDAAIEFSRRFTVPPLGFDFDLTFHPEGGNRLQGVLQTVAFKAIDNRGHSTPVEGILITSQGDTLGTFRSEHNGMGSLLLYTEGEGREIALVRCNGLEKRFQLPEAHPSGVALSVRPLRDNLAVTVHVKGHSDDYLTLIGHTRGNLLFEQPIPATSSTLIIPTESLNAGVLHLLLLKADEPLSERLWFIAPREAPEVAIDSLQASFESRSKVSFSLRTDTSQTGGGWYAMSITDNSLVKHDSLAGNIRSYLWLTSDLKGYVENPLHYLRPSDPLTRRHSDLLMLTQGWRRFDIGAWKRGDSIPSYVPEITQRLTGRVEKLSGKGADAEIIVYIPATDSKQVSKTDSDGFFTVDGLDIPDSALVMAQARNPKAIILPKLIVDTAFSAPPLRCKLPHNTDFHSTIPDNYLEESLATYYEQGGISSILLKETTVRGQKMERSILPSTSARRYIVVQGNPKLEDLPPSTLVSMIPGVFIRGAYSRVRGTSLPLVENINDMEYFSGSLRGLIGYIEVNKDGGISFYRKIPQSMPRPDDPTLKFFLAKGYEQKVEFYSPKYDAEYDKSINDRRTTLYWNPDLRFDENGNTSVSFFTADRKTDYRIVVEGISRDGTPVYMEDTLREPIE